MDRITAHSKINQALDNNQIDLAKSVAQEYNQQCKFDLCFTARQLKGFRILEEVVNYSESEVDAEQKDLLAELIQIKYTLEKGIFDLKCEAYSNLLKRTGMSQWRVV